MWHQVPKEVGVIVEKLMADLDGFFGELGQEMRAIADYFKLDLGIVVSLNFAYELRRVGSRMCSPFKSFCKEYSLV